MYFIKFYDKTLHVALGNIVIAIAVDAITIDLIQDIDVTMYNCQPFNAVEINDRIYVGCTNGVIIYIYDADTYANISNWKMPGGLMIFDFLVRCELSNSLFFTEVNQNGTSWVPLILRLDLNTLVLSTWKVLDGFWSIYNDFRLQLSIDYDCNLLVLIATIQTELFIITPQGTVSNHIAATNITMGELFYFFVATTGDFVEPWWRL